MDTPKSPTLAQRYADALWDADPDDLAQAEMTMALCYANHARRSDRAWVTDRRLMQQCKIRSAGTVGRVRESLISKGWLIPLHPETGAPLSNAERGDLQGKRKTITYRLTIPRSAPTIGAEPPPPTASTIGAEALETAPMVETAAPMIEATAPIIEADCSDDRSPLSYDSLSNPLNNSLSTPERRIMSATGATVEETREIISLMKDDALKKGKPIISLGPFVTTVAANGDLPEFLARVRAAAERRAAYAARQAQSPPGPAPEPPQATTTPAEKEAALAATRQRLDAIRRSQGQRGATGPTRLIPRPTPDANPDADTARAELLQGGDFDRWMKAAREKLGKDADRDEAVILAASLRRTTTPALGSPT